jgi:hypothetical protein
MRQSKPRQREQENFPRAADAAPPYKRAGVFLRIGTHGIDIAIALTPLFYFFPAPSGYVMVLTIWTYYFTCDLLLERTLGKLFTGMFYLTKDEQPIAKGALINRSFLRFLNILGVLSWRKTTLVDLFSGSRVFIKVPAPKKSYGQPESRRQFKLKR